jgi:UDP-N-acetylmuramyl pentapeptide phosphotransferase/UDP-N-acetylglucosamine-1-phosphate transferase
MYDIITAFITSFLVTFVAIPPIIRIAREKHLFDEPGERTSHTIGTPALGGIAIFAGVIFSVILWTPFEIFGELQYILSAFVIIFLIGAKDDIAPVSPTTKLIGQLFAAIILVFKSNVRITDLYGIFGIEALPEWAVISLSVFTIIVTINAFNLIDGINGLSGSITIIVAATLGTWFYLVDRLDLSIVAFSLAGSVVAFLKFNFTPADIFMGDTGAMLCGLVCAILTIEFIDFHVGPEAINSPYALKAVPAVAMGIMILPLFDTLRVFIMRLLKGKSPLHPDRTHIHHLMIDAGLTHMQATGILVIVNVFFILLVFLLQSIGTINLILIMSLIALMLTTILYTISLRRKSTVNR